VIVVPVAVSDVVVVREELVVVDVVPLTVVVVVVVVEVVVVIDVVQVVVEVDVSVVVVTSHSLQSKQVAQVQASDQPIFSL